MKAQIVFVVLALCVVLGAQADPGNGMDKTNCNKAGMNKTMSYGMKNKTMTGDYNKGMVKTYNSVAALVSSKEMFSTLLAAVKACNLTDALGASFKGTVFAPTNEAFAKLLKALNVTAAELLGKTDLVCKNVLPYHVVPNVVAKSSGLTNNQKVPTLLAGSSLTVMIKGKMVSIMGVGSTAMVTKADVMAGNAVVHVIDTVLLPTK
eukprot:jgi/Chrzof1/10285/Cz04g35190.t1